MKTHLSQFVCHKTIHGDDQTAEELEVCAGSILYMNKNAKRCADPELASLQDQFRQSGFDMKLILSLPEFMKHHKAASNKT